MSKFISFVWFYAAGAYSGEATRKRSGGVVIGDGETPWQGLKRPTCEDTTSSLHKKI